MTWILEDSTFVVVLGIVLTAIFGFGWLRTNLRLLAYAAGGTVIATVLLVLLERYVETPTEEVEAALHVMAADVERNDLEAALSHVHPSQTQTYARGKAEMPRYEFSRITIKRNLQITFAESDPSVATATFNAVAVGVVKAGNISFHQPAYVELTLKKENEDWQVTDYQYYRFEYGLMTPEARKKARSR